MSAPWPGLADARVIIGGTAATYAQARDAAMVLSASRTSAIAPVLRAARHPLAGCDYFAAAAPYIAAARALPKTGRAGAAGRHVTKIAFLQAITVACQAAEAEQLNRALEAFATDERYAVAMAREAVLLRERTHASRIRAAVRAAVVTAMAQCTEAACPLATACGTGKCKFAPREFASLSAEAPPGKLARPAGHFHAGAGFSDTAAVAEVLERQPYRVAVLAA